MTPRIALSLCLVWNLSAWAGVLAGETLDFGAPGLRFTVHDAAKREQRAERSETPDRRPALRIEWNNAKAKWIEVNVAPAPALPAFRTATARLELVAPDGCSARQINLRLRDAEGETFQFAFPSGALASGANVLSLDMDLDKPLNAWGGKSANKRVDFPAVLSGLTVVFGRGDGVDSLYLRRIDLERAPPAGTSRAQRKIAFDDAKAWRPVFYGAPGETSFGADGVEIRLPDKAMALFPRHTASGDLTFDDAPESATLEAELLEGEAEIRFLLRDGAGAEHRPAWQRLAPGANRLRVAGAGLPPEAKGPFVFLGPSLRASGDKPARVRIAGVVFELLERNIDAVAVSVDTRHPVNIVDPENGDGAALRLHNGGTQTVSARISATLFDLHGRESGGLPPSPLRLGPGEETVLPFPPPARRGIFYGRYTLADADAPDAAERAGAFSLAVMTPAAPTPLFDTGTFLFGVCSHPQLVPEAEQRRDADAAMCCGVKIMRTDASWRFYQPEPGRWDYTSLDRTVGIYADRGIETELIFGGAPAWAVAKDWRPVSREHAERLWTARPDYDAWRTQVARTAEHFRGRIRYYEIWNEPDLLSFANFTAEEYVRLLRLASDAIREADPGAKVMTAGFTCMPPYAGLSDQRFQEKALIEAAGAYDLHAFHGHGPFPHYFPQVERLLAMRERLGVRVPWYANETADHSVFSGERGQAATLWKKLLYSWARGAVGYNWYNLRDRGDDPRNPEHNYGLLRSDFSPKAAYPAYNTLARHFRGARFRREHAGPEGTRLFEFERDGETRLALWNDASGLPRQLLAFRAAASGAERVDLYDNRESVPANRGRMLATVGTEPFFLRFTAAAPECLGAVIQGEGGVAPPPGGVSETGFVLANPFGTAVEFRLDAEGPPGSSVSGVPARVGLTAGERRALAATVARDASADWVNPELRLHVAMDGGALAGTASVALAPELDVGEQYPGLPHFRLEHASQLTSLAPADPEKAHLAWTGPEDLSARGWLACRDGVLRLKLTVVDDRHHQPYRDGAVWQGDNVQWALRVSGQRRIWVFGLTHLADGTPQTHVWDAPDGFDGAAAAAAVSLRTERDETARETRYEASLPLAAVGADVEAARRGLRFNLLVNDNDGEMRESYLSLAPGIGETRDSSRYFRLRLRFADLMR